MKIETYDSKNPNDEVSFSIDVVNNIDYPTEQVLSCVCTIRLKSGTDPSTDFSSMINGTAAVNGTSITQSVKGGLDKNYYYIDFFVTTTQQKITFTLIIPVMIGA